VNTYLEPGLFASIERLLLAAAEVSWLVSSWIVDAHGRVY
jgi:hypothetical protein